MSVAGQVIARQLLVDKRPAAQALLQEVLVLQDASGQPAAGHLNLQLLEELLQLATPTGPPSGLSLTRQSLRDPGQVQPFDLIDFCEQQLGLPPGVVAAQLISPEAAGIRALLAQQLVHRWMTQSSRLQRPAKPNRAANSSPVVQRQGVQRQEHSNHVPTSAKRSWAGSSSLHEPQPRPATRGQYGWLAFALHAGVRGVKLVGQLCWLVVLIVTSRAVTRVLQSIQQLAGVVT